MRAAGESIVGRRDNNEDAFRVRDDLGLYLVADGMGGHEGGEVASRVVADVFTRFLQGPVTNPAIDLEAITLDDWSEPASTSEYPSSAGDSPRRDSGFVPTQKHMELVRRVERAIAMAQREIESLARGDLHEMGTTLAALLVDGAYAVVAHVGDSRVYRLRDGHIEQLTQDHSFVAELRAAGAWAILEHTTPQMSAMVTRCLARHANHEPDIEVHPVLDGDVFLLCSDGLSDVMDPRHIADTLRDFEDPDQASRELIRRAYRAGSQDNITAVVVRA